MVVRLVLDKMLIIAIPSLVIWVWLAPNLRHPFQWDRQNYKSTKITWFRNMNESFTFCVSHKIILFITDKIHPTEYHHRWHWGKCRWLWILVTFPKGSSARRSTWFNRSRTHRRDNKAIGHRSSELSKKFGCLQFQRLCIYSGELSITF